MSLIFLVQILLRPKKELTSLLVLSVLGFKGRRAEGMECN